MSRALRQLGATLSHVIKMGIVELSRFGGTTDEIQATMLDDDDVDDMPVYGPQGVAFRMPEGAEVMVVHAMGDAAIPACIGTNQRAARPTEKPGGGEVPEGAGGLHVLGSWRVYCDDAGYIYVGDVHAGTFEKMARADRVDAEFQRVWDHLGTTFAATVQDGGAGLWNLQVTAAGTADGLRQSTAADTVYGN